MRRLPRSWTSSAAPSLSEASEQREAAFWDEHVPSLEECRSEYEAGPDVLTAALIDALEPLAGARVLDFACGAGVLSAWLARRGAQVVGLDVSAGSVARARELADAVGARVGLVTGQLAAETPAGSFDRVCGRYALHHTDVAQTAPLLAGKLRDGGSGAFLETMGLNPLLRAARRLPGRFGIPRYGSEDEHPLVRRDLEELRAAFGEVRLLVPQTVFLRLADRQLLRYRHRRVSALLGAADDALGRLGLSWLGYQQLVVVRKSRHASSA